MKKIILPSCTLFLIMCAQITFSQSISSEVISNSGEKFIASNVSLNWTLGESATDVLMSGSYIHTQGFHQTYQNATNVDTEILNSSVSVYPNPCYDFLTVKLKELNQDVSIELYDPSGKMILRYENISNESYQVNMNQYTEGKYLLRVISNQTTTFGIIKSSK